MVNVERAEEGEGSVCEDWGAGDWIAGAGGMTEVEGTSEAGAQPEAGAVRGVAVTKTLLQGEAVEAGISVVQWTEGSEMTGPFLVPPADHAEQLAGELARELSKGQGAVAVVVEAAAVVESAAVVEAAAGVEAAAVLEAAVVVEAAAVVAGRQGSLQKSQRKRGLKVESALVPGGLAPKRLRKEVSWRFNAGRRQKEGKGRRRGGGAKGGQGQGRWSMPGFRVDPGGASLVVGSYIVQAVQTQVTIKGAAGRETWLGVDLLRGGSGVKVTGWMHSGELQRRAAGDAGWLARLRGRAREGWSVEDHSWVCSGGPAVTGHGLRGAVVGWYLPVLVVAEKKMKRVGGASVMVLMKRVAIGRTAGGVEQAVGIRCRQEWHRHKLSREQLVGITGQRVRADGDKEVLMVGQEIWEEWSGQTVEDTEWRRQAKGQWRAKEQAVVRRGWDKNEVHDKDKVDRDKVYDRG